jgi:hypothetical protein
MMPSRRRIDKIADTSLKVHPELITAVLPTSPARAEVRAIRRVRIWRTVAFVDEARSMAIGVFM